ncbi:MAG: family 78 glycoside hydrolase catalytic domain [Bacteroidales bacterium]|nr:family 78 glycoside hydrolase catalytic domain [Bacteroidales bacterium]
MIRKKSANLISYINLLCIICMNVSMYASAPYSPENLRTCDKTDPIGVGSLPYFGWYFMDPDNNEMQTAYQILVASSKELLEENNADMWNSEKISSSMVNYIEYGGTALNPATKYYWKVRTWDKNDEEGPYSDISSFGSGLFTHNDWAGAFWIRRNSKDADDYTYFRKKITLPAKPVKRCIAYISACHSFELSLNGQFIGKGYSYHYPQYAYYQALDITKNVLSGKENIISLLTHWHGGGQGRAPGARGLLFKTIVEFDDGEIMEIGSDGTWKQKQVEAWAPDQPQRNGEGIGRVEKIDSRKFISDWNKLHFDDTSWDNAEVIGIPPVEPWTGELRPDLTRVIEYEIKPKSITHLGKGKYVIDLGKIYAGMPQISFHGGEAGSTVTILGGFVLNEDGSVSATVNQDANMNYYFILNGKDATFCPMLYLGMRYIQVEHAPIELEMEDVSFICRHYELNENRGYFNSSNAMLNKVWNLMCYSLIAGTHEDFVDTPTREKGPFLGDSWSQSVPAMSVMGDRTMSLKALLEFLDSQEQYWPDGRLNAVYPNGDGGRDIPDYTQSFLVWVWDYYLQTGNISFLKTHYNQLKKVAQYVETYQKKETGLIHNLAGGRGPYEFGIIDWPATMRYGYDMETESRTVVDVYAYLDYLVISNIAKVTGNIKDADEYKLKANNIKDAINNKLVNKDGIYIDGLKSDLSQSTHASQHSNMMPVAAGIVPEENLEPVTQIVKNWKMSVGMVTLRWLPDAIGKGGDGEHLLELYTNTSWDGWAKIIEQGASVTWESWDAPEHNFSLSHPWGAVGMLGIQEYILGVKPLKAQHEVIQVKPLDFKDKLSFAEGILPTDRGDIQLRWDRKDLKFSMTLKIPDNMQAEVYIPGGGVTHTEAKLNGKTVKCEPDGDFLYIGLIGSGEYTIEREIAGR